MRFILCLLFIVGCTSCDPIKYKSDLTFISSGFANSPEYFVRISGKPCKDMDGIIGGCYKRHKKNRDLKFELAAQRYAYTFKLSCTEGILAGYQANQNEPINILKNKAFDFEISNLVLRRFKRFICRGRVFPADKRPKDTDAFFEVRVVLVDADYTFRESINKQTYKKKPYVVLGKHARLGKIYADNKWHYLREKPFLQTAATEYCAMSESLKMRYNYRCVGYRW